MVHRVQQIISKSAEYGRKVAITGRSMLNIVGVATELEYMTVPDGVLVDINDIKKYPPEQMTNYYNRQPGRTDERALQNGVLQS